jgi:hypothetical protein
MKGLSTYSLLSISNMPDIRDGKITSVLPVNNNLHLSH